MTPTKIRPHWLLGALALAAGACNSAYLYTPAENATAQIHGRMAADYQIPPGAPQGDVRIASFGVAKVTPKQAAITQPMRTMHVRLVISNQSAQPWIFDTREQIADVRNFGQVRPAFARSDAGDLPTVNIEPNGKRTIDLFFPLPAGAQKASKIPEFDISWRVQTGAQVVAERTPFERLAIEPVYAGAYGWYPYGFGPFMWYDPVWGPGVVGAPAWYW